MNEYMKLLERWSELEPGRCQKQGSSYLFFYDDRNPMWYGVNGSCPGLLQPAVQQAIEARGWYWSAGNTEDGGYTAYVSWSHKTGDTSTGYGESPAHALLSAYDQALEATMEETL